MTLTKIKLTEHAGIATLAFNRPERDNAADAEMMQALVDALGRLSAAHQVRILVLRGEGEHFCAGREPGSTLPKNPREWSGVLGQIVKTNQALASFPGITIAAVKGKAHGFGCGLATQCDITLAAEDSHFGFPEIKAGFPPTIVMSYLSRWTARKKAFEWVITGEDIDAREADRFGLVNRVVPKADLDAELNRWMEILLQRDYQALLACKAFFRDTAHLDPDDAYKYGVMFLANFNASRQS